MIIYLVLLWSSQNFFKATLTYDTISPSTRISSEISWKLVITFNHVFQYHANQSIESVLNLREIFLALFCAFLCFLQLLISGLSLASEFFEVMFESLFFIYDEPVGFLERCKLALVIKWLFLLGLERFLNGEEVVLSLG